MVSKEERKDPKSLNFTLNRTKPLSYSVKPKDINAAPTRFEKSIADKPKLQPNEEKIALFKLLHRNTHHIVTVDNLQTTEHVTAMRIMRDGYNEGRNGTWNNYTSLKGQYKGTYVKPFKPFKSKNSQNN
mmetsp:Transcript_15426/g.13155  ORF Transcript_15426/g.13155 Transcript_15426/m.13155 type:complete len:129 (+) Transcript_15426:794-1180(+)